MERLRAWASVCVLLYASATLAAELPDSRTHPTTGNVETVSAYWSGSSLDVRHIIDPGPGSSTVTTLADGSDDERGARIEIDDDDDTWVVYWRATTTHEVVARVYDFSDESWSDEIAVSDGAVGSRRPSLAHDGTVAWVGYETSLTGETGIELGQIIDDVNPVGRVLVGTTTWSGSVDVQVLHEDGETWVTWVDSGSDVAWSVHDAATGWSDPETESYASDSVEQARKRIRDEVLGL